MSFKNLILLRTLYLIVGILGALGWANGLSAQWAVGAELIISIPLNDFADVCDTGGGLALRGHYRARKFPFLSLRGDATFITYEYQQHIEQGYLVETRTQSIRFTVGPQFSVRVRRIELYLSSMYGMYNFFTREEIPYTIFSRTRGNNTEFGWNVNGGLLIDIARLPERSFDLALNLGGSWHTVPEGFITRIEVGGDPVDVKRDVEEIGIHAGLVLLFR
ncbi:MAG: hypothetical protein ACE5OR_01965 [bacterium]